MKQILKSLKFPCVFIASAGLFVTAGCIEDNARPVTEGGIGGTGGNRIFGNIQKGPFVANSEVTLQLLGANMEPASVLVTTTTSYELGDYQADIQGTGLLEVKAKGLFWDEFTGIPSEHEISLSALYSIPDDTTDEPNTSSQVNVNVLTHLTHERIKHLMSEESQDFTTAQTNAENELKQQLQTAFPLDNSEKFSNLSMYNTPDNNAEGNAYLLAVTSALYQHALNQIPTDEPNPDDIIKDVLTKAANDFTDDGNFDTTQLVSELQEVVATLNPAQVSYNLSQLVEPDLNITVANIDLVLDTDGDGEANYKDNDDDNDGIYDEDDGEPYNHDNDDTHKIGPVQVIVTMEGLQGEVTIVDQQSSYQGQYQRRETFVQSGNQLFGAVLPGVFYDLVIEQQPVNGLCSLSNSSGQAGSEENNNIVLTCNDFPVITLGASTSITMSEDNAPTAFALTLDATDTDSDPLTWSVTGQPSNGLATATDGNSSTISYSPSADYNGSDSFNVSVSDGNGGTDTITVNVAIAAVNDQPVITQGASTSVTMSKDSAPTAFALTLDASDADSDPLTWSVTSQPSYGSAAATDDNSSAISYNPSPDYYGSDSFEVTVSDGNGGTDTITVNVAITAVRL